MRKTSIMFWGKSYKEQHSSVYSLSLEAPFFCDLNKYDKTKLKAKS